jgi:hypothetical protein
MFYYRNADGRKFPLRVVVLGLCFIAGSLFIPASTFGQTVTGRVLNTKGIAIPYAIVRLSTIADQHVVQQKLCDSVGQFFITIDRGSYHMEIRALGYRAFQLDSVFSRTNDKSVGLAPFVLTEDSSMLHGVEILGVRKEMLERKGDKLILNLGESLLAKQTTGMEALTLVPGISTVGKVVNVSGRENTEIWLNGKKSKIDLTQIPAEQIERIEIIENPSAAYDANAGAIINVVLRKWAQEGVQGELSGNFRQGFYSGEEGSALLNFNSGNWTSHIQASGGNSKTLFKSYQQTYFPASSSIMNQYETHLDQTAFLNVGTEWKPDSRQTISLEGEFNFNKSPHATDLALYDFYSTGPSKDSSTYSLSTTNYQSQAGSLRLAYDIKLDSMGRSLNLSAEAYSTQETVATDYLFEFTNLDGTNQQQSQRYLSNRATMANILAIRGEYTHPISKTQRLSAGFKASAPGLNSSVDFYSSPNQAQPAWVYLPARSSIFNSGEQIYAIYGTWSGNWSKWNAQAGLRAELTEGRGSFNSQQNLVYTYNNLFPSASLSYSASDKHQFAFSYSRKIARPGFSQLNPYLTFLGPYSVFEGAPDLKPQYNNNANLSWTLFKKYTISLFYNYRHNYISQISEQDDQTKITLYREANYNSENAGLGFNIPVRVCSWLSLSNTANLMYQDEMGSIKGIGFYRQVVVLELVAVQTVNLPFQIHMRSTAVYRSASKYGIINAGPIAYYDCSLERSFVAGKLELALKAQDVFHSYLDTYTVQFSNMNKNGYHNWDSQNIRFVLTWKFDRGRKANQSQQDNAAEDEKGRVH